MRESEGRSSKPVNLIDALCMITLYTNLNRILAENNRPLDLSRRRMYGGPSYPSGQGRSSSGFNGNYGNYTPRHLTRKVPR